MNPFNRFFENQNVFAGWFFTLLFIAQFVCAAVNFFVGYHSASWANLGVGFANLIVAAFMWQSANR